jgi:hypothetical protein
MLKIGNAILCLSEPTTKRLTIKFLLAYCQSINTCLNINNKNNGEKYE